MAPYRSAATASQLRRSKDALFTDSPTEDVVVIWIILAALGVPLWLCALAILALMYRNRALRQRPGDVPVDPGPRGVGQGCLRLARQPRRVD